LFNTKNGVYEIVRRVQYYTKKAYRICKEDKCYDAEVQSQPWNHVKPRGTLIAWIFSISIHKRKFAGDGVYKI